MTSVETATEALALSLNERAKVDLPYMAQLTGKTEENYRRAGWSYLQKSTDRPVGKRR